MPPAYLSHTTCSSLSLPHMLTSAMLTCSPQPHHLLISATLICSPPPHSPTYLSHTTCSSFSLPHMLTSAMLTCSPQPCSHAHPSVPFTPPSDLYFFLVFSLCSAPTIYNFQSVHPTHFPYPTPQNGYLWKEAQNTQESPSSSVCWD